MSKEWIPCKERMPERGVSVLVIAGSIMWVDEVWDSGIGLSFCEDNYDMVTHWMPLPSPPEK